jgi:hypothetical protein
MSAFQSSYFYSTQAFYLSSCHHGNSAIVLLGTQTLLRIRERDQGDQGNTYLEREACEPPIINLEGADRAEERNYGAQFQTPARHDNRGMDGRLKEWYDIVDGHVRLNMFVEAALTAHNAPRDVPTFAEGLEGFEEAYSRVCR